jgi:glycosyltransferase involved in cell wall biosynthesis
MACGVPVVSTRVGIVAERPGLARTAGAACGLADGLLMDEARPDEARRRAAKAREFVRGAYRPDTMADAWVKLIGEVAGG